MGLYRLLYALGTRLYFWGIWLVAPFVSKARLWVQGRQGWRTKLAEFGPGGQTVWVHCASLGEFEQGRPIIEEIRAQYPDARIVLTFFSPSGYEVRKNYPHADLVCYLPADTPGNARYFVQCIRPTVAVFVKYELWLFYLRELKRQQVPTLLVSAHFTAGHRYTRGVQRGLFRHLMGHFTHIFVQQQPSVDLLKRLLGPQAPVSCSGDTRFDRVMAIAGSFNPITSIGWFARQRFTLVCGSTWPPDEDVIFDALAELERTHPGQVCAIVAPHEVTDERVQNLLQRAPKRTVRFSEFEEPDEEQNVLVIDNIGMLARLYHYADLCYVGGGFGKGIHNVLEAAVYGQRVVFGPNHQRFQEAQELLRLGAARSLNTATDLVQEVVAGIQREPQFLRAQELAHDFVEAGVGATAVILDYIEQYGLLVHNVQAEEMEELT